ncbi:MAG: hypothetical protein WCR27_05220 [Eubacteriales bacterium]
MNKCIYLKGIEPQLTFNSGEHIIPAGIGGIMKLPNGIVSDQVNTKVFSPLELDFMRNSIISLPRQFDGPGKRGSFVPEKASKSNIHIMVSNDDGSLNLGYIKLAKPYLIPQVRVCPSESVHIIFDKTEGAPNLQIKQLTKNMQEFDGKYQEINDDRISVDDFLLGTDNDRWYLAKNPNREITNLLEIVDKIINSVDSENIEPGFQSSQMTSHQSMAFNIESYFRVCAKIVFNFLALSKGQDFVLKEEFDLIRGWILNGGENEFVQLMDKEGKPEFLEQIPFPHLSHKILITESKDKLFGIISFYGANFEAVVKLAENITLNDFVLDGFICDWKNKKEYRLVEFISSLGGSSDFA